MDICNGHQILLPLPMCVSVCLSSCISLLHVCMCSHSIFIVMCPSCDWHFTGEEPFARSARAESELGRASLGKGGWSLCTFVRCILYSFFIFPVHIHVSLHIHVFCLPPHIHVKIRRQSVIGGCCKRDRTNIININSEMRRR